MIQTYVQQLRYYISHNEGSRAPMTDNLITIADQFTQTGKVTDVRPFGSGNINDTFLVKVSTQQNFVLQRINTQVFRQPQLVMQNSTLR